MKKKILFIFGTRPEAIKLASLIKEFQNNEKYFTPIVCSTGQHKEMLDQVVDFFKLQIDYDLQLMRKNQTLSSLSSNILSALDKVIGEVAPDYVFVHGDTTTSTFAAISAFYNQVPVCHIEAGLRTFNKYSPYPEEMNRSITGRIAEYHFSPTVESKQNLVKENIDEKSILVTGNTVIDALLFTVNELKTYENNEIKTLKSLMVKGKKNILVTGHRRENFGIGFENICNALLEIANDDNVQVIYPVHLNPNVTSIVEKILGSHDNIHLVSPLNYPAFVWLMTQSTLILTDSGGVQEEAPSLGVPVLVMRNNTERPEGVEEGTAILVGTDKEKIVNTTQKLLKDQNFYDSISRVNNPYGDGDSSKNILNFLIDRDNK
jgi:UDP-N-acetylglucosamine 2-epimerase (non-hydrolysing)